MSEPTPEAVGTRFTWEQSSCMVEQIIALKAEVARLRTEIVLTQEISDGWMRMANDQSKAKNALAREVERLRAQLHTC